MDLSSIAAAIPPLNLRSCLIHRHGEIIYEHYRHSQIAEELSKVNSCTKSYLSALICIALDHGILPSADTKLQEFFPQLRKDKDSRKQHITLRHLLTMTGGWHWTEFGGHNSFPRMTRSPDWVGFALDQPLSHQPGEVMEYNSGSSQILSAVLAQASGLSITRYAEEYLFGPLGIEAYRWEQDPQGIHTGGFGLWLRPCDLLSLGLLYLQKGKWKQRQLISSNYVELSVSPAIDVTAPWRGSYAWHWWNDSFEEGGGPGYDYFYARGYGGQFIYVIPSLETIVVLTDDRRKREHPPADVFRRFIAPYF